MEERDDWTLTEALHYDHGRADPFAAAVRSTRMAMIITDPQLPDNPIVFANKAFQTLTGYQRDELLGRNCRLLQGSETNPETVQRLRTAVEAGTDVSVDILNYRKNGTTFWNALYMSPVRDDAGAIQFFFASQMDITDRIDRQSRIAREKARVEAEVGRRVAELRSSLDAQRLLLHEVDHRVKNNMTMIGSILRLHMREADDPGTRDMLRAMMARIDALATVHRHLYQAEDVTRFDIGAYAVNLASDLIQGNQHRQLRIRADLDRAEVPAGQASAVGLIINEILARAIRVNEPDLPDAVIALRAWTERDQVHLTIDMEGHDDDVSAMPSGLGERIITRLAAQARSQVSWSAAEKGIRAHVTVSREQ
ncbi:PAS domain-containing protein [Paracoccus sp. (in: a-proteobacteria)]|uniref:PAS domain-containing protein n=1 Tax=Paracoccus sp. TaxID=267 RepID=UPI00396C7FA6